MGRRSKMFLSLVLVMAFLSGGRAQATTGAAITVSTVSHGVRLTMTVPGDEFSEGALVRVRTSIENVSTHPIQLAATCPPWGTPWVAVLDGIGNVAYPPAVTAVGVKGRTKCSKLYLFTRLSPGATLRTTRLIVLRDPRLQARVTLATRVVAGNLVEGWRDMQGKTVAVHLLPATPLAATVTSSPTLQVTVPLPSPDPGPLYYQYVLRCDTSSGASYPGTWTWQHTTGPTIDLTPPTYCASTSEWHIAAGYLDHPVATIDYTTPARWM
jgi:hypothetical protein